MTKVVALVRRDRNESLIEALKETLAAAEAGEIIGMAGVKLRPDSRFGCFRVGDCSDLELAGALSFAQHDPHFEQSAEVGERPMTISISVSVNGNYKVPVTTKYGDNEPTTEVITGRGHEGPFVKNIPYYHGSNPSNIVHVSVGPEEQDNG